MTAHGFRRSRIAGLIAAAALAGILLTGCQKQVKDESTPAPTPSASATAEPKAEPITGEPGDPLTAEEAKQLNGQRGTLRPYELADGSWIILDVKKPLPESVRAEVAAAISSTSNADTGAFLRSVEAQSAATGKTLVVVREIYAGERDSGETTLAWRTASYAAGFEGIVGVATAEEAVAQIQPWIAAQRDPAQLELIVVEG